MSYPEIHVGECSRHTEEQYSVPSHCCRTFWLVLTKGHRKSVLLMVSEKHTIGA